VVADLLVRVVAAGRVRVQHDVGESRDPVEQPVAGLFEDVVGRGQVEGPVEGDIGIRVELVADPPDTHPVPVMGDASSIITTESPISISACAIVSPGPGMRMRSVAPKASV
jgi:hypothetical protein